MYRNLMSMFRRSERRTGDALHELDDRMLADIGLTRGDVNLMRAGKFNRAFRTHE